MKGRNVHALGIRNLATVAPLALFAMFTGSAAVAAIDITNPELLFEPGAAVVSLSSSTSSVDWNVKNIAGTTVASGTVSTSGGTGSINLNGLQPGYYSLQLAGAFVGTINTSLGIITNLSAVPSTATAKFGTTAHPELMPDPDYAGLLQKAGLAFVRFDMRWQQIEPTPGNYTFAPTTPFFVDYDTVIGSLTNAGIKPMVMLGYSNPNYDNDTRPSSPAGRTAYANYAAAIADRYGASIDYEIYNEYNHPYGPVMGTCGASLSCYLPMLQEARAAIHAEAPNAKVVLTGMAGLSPWWLGGDTQVDPATNFISYNWLKDFMDQGGGGYVDAFNIHNYTVVPTANGYVFGVPENNNEAIVASVKSLLAQYPSASGKPLWLGETGWSTYPYAPGISEALQAAYLVRDAVLSLRQGLDRYEWYDLFDDTADLNVNGSWGMLRNPTNHPAIAPKPSFVAQAVLTRQLDGYDYSSSDTIQTGVYSVQFTKSASPSKRIMWSTAGLPREINVAASSAITVTSHLGTVSTVTPSGGVARISLTGNPIYVSGGNISGFTPANLALGKTVTASSTLGTYVAANAVDADPQTWWQAPYAMYPSVLTVDLGASHSVKGVRLAIPPDWYVRNQTFSIEGSTNGSTFSTIVGSTQYQFGPSNGNIVDVSFPATTARYVRISVTANSDFWTNAGQFSNFEVYGQ